MPENNWCRGIDLCIFLGIIGAGKQGRLTAMKRIQKIIGYKIIERDSGKLVRTTRSCEEMSRYADKCLEGTFYPKYIIETIVK